MAPSKITCLESHFHHVFAGWDHSVGIYKRGRLEKVIDLQDVSGDEGPVNDILLFGGYLCISTDKTVRVYKVDLKSYDYEIYTSYTVSTMTGSVKQLIHMPTYLNKILIVTTNSLMILNIRSGKLKFTSDKFADETISCVEAAPVLDTVAVCTTTGEVYIYNIKKDKVLFNLSTGVRITSVSFRTDGSAHLACGSFDGDIFFYDLNTRRRIHSARGTHAASMCGVSRVHYLSGQSIVVSNGADNLLNEMVFDPAISSNKTVTSPPRFLRSRGGHSLPPSVLEFADEEAHFILSGSLDRTLWSFSLRKDSQSHMFSQRTSNNKKQSVSSSERFPEITALAFQADKQNRWDNILTAHKNLEYARSWSGKRGIVGKHMFPSADGSIVKSVCISNCGNFGLVGSVNGSIAVYNLQSGILRRKILKAHQKTVSAVAIDSLNTVIISSSYDEKVKFHSFKTGVLENELDLGSSIIDMRFHHRSGLVAVSLDDLTIVVVDVVTRKIVRVLAGHSNRITSFDFSPDGRWIISASLDRTVRTWDLPAGGCIDAVKMEKVVTCLRVSPNGDWIATSHVNGVGIQLWTQKAQFFSMVSLRLISDEEIRQIEMPNAAGENGSNVLDGALDKDIEEIIEGTGAQSTVNRQLSEDLITLSLAPRSKFNMLVNIEAIKERNKPTEAPKKPEKAPFFLSGPLEKQKEESQMMEEVSRVPGRNGQVKGESDFTRFLREQDSEQIISHLKSLSPAMTDIEIRALNTLPPYSELIAFVNALAHTLKKSIDYELVQAWLAMLLRVHGDVFAVVDEQTNGGSTLMESINECTEEQKAAAQKLDDLVRYCTGVIQYLRTV